MSGFDAPTAPQKGSEGGTVSAKAVRYASWVAFFAWVFAVYDYITFGTVLPKIAETFGWSTATSTAIVTIISLGIFFVSMSVGILLDRVGRRKSLIITTVGAALSSGLTALSPATWFVVVVRFISGLGYSEQAVNATYLNELYEAAEDRDVRKRGKGLSYSLVQGGWPVGVLFAALMASLLLPIGGWRLVFAIATFPAIVMAILGRKLVETPQFTALEKLRKGLHDKSSAKSPTSGGAIETAKAADRSPYVQLFESGYRKHTIFLALAFLLNWFGALVFAVLGTTVLTKARGVSFSSSLVILVVSNGVAFIGYIVHGIVGDKIGRRETIAIGWVLSGICYALMLFVVQGYAMILVFYSLGLFFLIGPYAALLFYMGESYPARMRGTGTSVVNAMGPVGAIIGGALLTAFLGSGISMAGSAALAGVIPIVLSGFLIMGARHMAPGEVIEDSYANPAVEGIL